MTSPAAPDPIQQQLDVLNQRAGAVEVRLAKVEVQQRSIAEEQHGYLTNVSMIATKHGKLEEKIDGLREQQKAQHRQTSGQLTDLAAGLKPLTDAFATPDAAEDAFKALAGRQAFWRDIWRGVARDAAGLAVKGVVLLLILGLLAALSEKLGISHLTGAAAVSTGSEKPL